MAGTISTIVLSDGAKRYRARYRDVGGRQHEKRFSRKVDAQHWLDEQTSALVTQTWTAPERGRVTVAAWAEQWSAAQTGLKPSTLYGYRSILRARIVPRWGQYRLADVTHAEIAAWVAGLVSSDLAPSSVRQAHRVFSLLLTLAVRDGRIPRNPAVGVPLPRVRRADPRFLNRNEVERLAEAAGEYGDVVHLLAYTGLRFGEMAALRVRRVDFLRKRLTVAESATEVGGTVEYGAPKSHQQRTVPIPGVLMAPLSRRCEGKGRDDLVLTSPEGAVLRSGNFRRRVFDPAARAAGLEDLSPHDLRHTAASLLVASGANVKAVQRMLGHASAAMTLDVYSGLFDDDLGGLADRMDAAHDAHTSSRSVGAVWARDPIVKITDQDASR
ncbi:Site-specific recombinase XerD [Modestobacter sp. DSM 44400]|uniref:tyrosine-type recombinase/integrase n=1 Tax=Modestobacter sp. DSM 44400 TaxID=1550230 RepID=UPI00089B10D2|nr:site-specific integrase [Modestobacter sp. DSM 44400]SDY51583.1 Site-specific recombinase XerD [Modestobacter sp. DSM 44400]